MGKRTVEFVLGLLGGIFGFIGAIITITVGGIGSAFGATDASQVTTLGGVAVIFAIIGIVGAALVKGKSKIGGWLMTASAVGGLICVSLYYLLAFVLLIIAGLMALIKKDK